MQRLQFARNDVFCTVVDDFNWIQKKNIDIYWCIEMYLLLDSIFLHGVWLTNKKHTYWRS